MTPTTVKGRLVSVDEAPKNRRLIIDIATIDRVDSAALPDRVRVNWRGAAFDALPGDIVMLRAGLAPPPAPAGYAAHVKGATVAISSDPLELAEDCRRADLVMALHPVAARAKSACTARLIDRRSVWDEGAQAVWIDGEAIRVRTVSEIRGERPWTASARLSASPTR